MKMDMAGVSTVNKANVFEEDTKILTTQANILLNVLYPYYMVDSNKIKEHIECNSAELMDGFTYYRIASCAIEDMEEKFAYLNQKMEKFFTAIHFANITVAYGIIGYSGMTNIVIGINKRDAVLMTNIIKGLLAGAELVPMVPAFMKRSVQFKHFGTLHGIPTTHIDDKPQTFDISTLMRSLNGQNYSLFFIAKPMPSTIITDKWNQLRQIRDQCFAISKRSFSRQSNITSSETKAKGSSNGWNIIAYNSGKNWNESISKAISEGETISGDIQNGFALELMDYAEHGIERIKRGQSCGMWQTAITYSSDNALVRDIIQACLYGEISKPTPNLLPAKAFSFDQNDGQVLLLPKDLVAGGVYENPLCTLVTSAEVGLLCTLPVDSVPYFELRHHKQYPLVADSIGKESVVLGNIADNGRRIENMPFAISEADLNKHTFVCGITGSGKTTTVKGILKNCNKPFLVIESAKKEYRNIKLDDKKTPQIYTLGKPEINCLQMNPFYVMAGVSPQTHIDYLKDLFNAAFSFYGPMPYILEKCLQNVYKNKGWNLTLGYHPFLVNKNKPEDFFDYTAMTKKYSIHSHKYLFPTMHDLKCEIQRYIDDEMQYDGEVGGNIKTAIKTRLDSLCNGAKGYMFNTHEYVDLEKLLNENVVLELEGLADDSDKAFCVGLLIVFISEYRQIFKEVQGSARKGLQHLLVIEEAHRLLKNVETERVSENLGNPKGKAVEHFANMIAEMRSYGQGVIIAEQIPSKLAPDVIKNSSNKIVQRIVSVDDQAIMANTIGMHEEEAIYLGSLKTGQALCHKEGMHQPVNVIINPIEERLVLDENLYNKDIEQRVRRINLSLVKDAFADDTDKVAFKLINTLLICDNDCCVTAIEEVQDEIESCLCKKCVELVLFCTQNEKNKILAELLSGSLQSLFMTGICSVGKLIPCEISELLFDLLKSPTENKVQAIKEQIKQLYARDARNQGITIVSEMMKYQYQKGIDIPASIKNFFIKCNEQDVEAVMNAMKNGGAR